MLSVFSPLLRGVDMARKRVLIEVVGRLRVDKDLPFDVRLKEEEGGEVKDRLLFPPSRPVTLVKGDDVGSG